MELLLTLYGHQAVAAYDGPTALTLARQVVPDAVLLDLALPEMDGFSLAQRIRELPGCQNVVLVAHTGWTQQRFRQRARALGFAGYVLKPVEYCELRALLHSRER